MGFPLIIAIGGVISGFLATLFYKVILEPVIDIIGKYKKIHNRELIDEILNPLQRSTLKHKDFKIWIDRLELLENLAICEKGDIYKWAFQHLQHKDYSDILISFQIVETWIVEINIKLKNLDAYIDSKINEKYRKDFAHYIWDIVQTAFYEDTDVDCIKIKEVKDNNIYIYRNKKDSFRIPCIFDEEKTKKLVLKLIERKEFISQLEIIQEEYNELRKEFRERFQGTFLKKLMVDYKRKGKLKGRCKDCSRLVKYFGDC